MMLFRISLMLLSLQSLALNVQGLDNFFNDFHNFTETFFTISGDAHNTSLSIQDFLAFIEANWPDMVKNINDISQLPSAMRYSSDTLATALNGTQIAFFVMGGCIVVHAGFHFLPKVWAYCENKEPYAQD